MRIALSSSKFLPTVGGSEIVIDNLAREFSRVGAEVVVIAPWCIGCKEVDRELPYSVYRHRPFITKRYGTRFYRGVLEAAYSKFPFDILHCQQSYPAVVFGAKFKERHPEVKLVLTSHGHDLDSDYPRFKSRYIFTQTKKALEAVDGFVALNPLLKEQFLQFNQHATIVDCCNGAFLPDGVKAAHEPYILFLGRLSKRKGVETLLRAFAKLSSSQRLQLVIAGSGREERTLKRLARELEIEPEVSFLGAVSGESKTALIHGAKFVVVPTISWEASSLVAIEAMVTGKAVIGSDVMGINQLIEDGASGLLFAPRSSDDLALAMKRLMADEELRSSIESYNFAHKGRYLWEAVARRYFELYRTVSDGASVVAKDELVASGQRRSN